MPKHDSYLFLEVFFGKAYRDCHNYYDADIYIFKDILFKCHIIVIQLYLKCLLVKLIMMQIYKSLLVRCQIIKQTYFKSRLVKCHSMMKIYFLKDLLFSVMQIY